MNNNDSHILTVNAGSSSIKFTLFGGVDLTEKKFEGNIDAESDASVIINKIKENIGQVDSLIAIGHRIVQGGPNYHNPDIIDDKMLKELRSLELFDPEHLSKEIKLIEEFQTLFPSIPQIACFDTAFHKNLPRVAQILPIPRRYEAQGIKRYGFHGLSYTFLMKELARIHGEGVSKGRVILAHLGSGASLAAVYDGESIDTSMSFTPASGILMSTRSGDLDPGLGWYFNQKYGMDSKQFNEMINNESGLLGVSETSADMKTLLEHEDDDSRASEAVNLFCYEVKKYIGAYAAVIGGVDTIVFAGGMGEVAPKIRAKICRGLEFLGIEIDENKNNTNAEIISKETSKTTVLVIHTDEEATIAEEVRKIISNKN